MYLITILISAVVGFVVYLFCRHSTHKSIERLNTVLSNLAEGNISQKLDVNKQGSFAPLANNINNVIDNLHEASKFSEKIGEGDFSVNYESKGDGDVLGESLAGMLSRLQQVSEQDQVRRWVTEGLAQFSEIFRSNSQDLLALSKVTIVELVNYMEVNQGGFFIYNDEDPEEPILELTACYAYSREKYMKKNVPIGDGLIGQAFLEKETIYMTEVPQNYTEITSGLGEATPSSILIVPLKINDQVEGVLEVASFEEFNAYQIEFVEKLAESIAATITSVKINEKTRKLLVQSQEQAERMRTQEEEMRQKNEELQTSQDEMQRQKIQLETVLKEATSQEASLTSLINNTSDMILTIDPTYNIQIFNNAFERYYNSLKGELAELEVGSNLLEVYPDTYKVSFQNDFDKALKGEQFYVQRKMIGNGSFNIFDIFYSPIEAETGGVSGVAIYSKDVTEYIKKNEEIRRSQQEIAQQASQLQHTKEAVNRSGVATLELDMDGYVLDANDAFLKIMKYDDLDEVLGESHEIFMPPQQLNTSAYTTFWNKLRNGESSSAQYERRTKTGDTVWLAGSYNVVTETNGRAIMVIQVGFDVTETVELLYKTLSQGQQIQMAQNEAKKQADQLLLEKMKQEAIVHTFTVAIMQFDLRGNIEFCNKAFQDLFKIQNDDLTDKKVRDILPITVEPASEKTSKISLIQADGKEVEFNADQTIRVSTEQKGEIDCKISIRHNEIGNYANYTLILQKAAVKKQTNG